MDMMRRSGESLKTTGLGKWLLFSAVHGSAHESALLHSSGKLPACVLGASLHGGYETLNKGYSIWKILVFYRNIRQKSFSNFSLSIFRAYILIILGDVMRNKGDRDTFPCCLENIFELDTDQLSLLFCPIAALLDFTNALSPFYINHQVNVAAKISLHCTSAKKRTDKLINWGFFFIIYVCFSKLQYTSLLCIPWLSILYLLCENNQQFLTVTKCELLIRETTILSSKTFWNYCRYCVIWLFQYSTYS